MTLPLSAGKNSDIAAFGKVHTDMKKSLIPFAMPALLLGLLAPVASAHHATASGSITVIAKGFNNPRGLAIASDGTLYLAEAGAGGKGPCAKVDGGMDCYGPSGAIVKISGGKVTPVLSGLPSVAAAGGAEATGPSDVAVNADGSLEVTIQGDDLTSPKTYGKGGAWFQHVIHVSASGMGQPGANLYAYEKANNPDGAEINSDPYSIAKSGSLDIVTDAAANDLLSISAAGKISTLAVFPSRKVAMPGGKTGQMEAVPDTVAVGSDGAYYVGQLTGYPFPVGGAEIFRVVPGQKPVVYAKGFTNIIALAFAPDRSLYVLEILKGGLGNADPKKPATLEGELLRIAPDGTKTIVAANGLVGPAGLAISQSGAIYVSNYGVFPGAGEVVQVNP